MQDDISSRSRHFPGIPLNRMTMRKLLAVVVVVASLVLLFVQFGPSVVFGSEPAGARRVRIGIH